MKARSQLPRKPGNQFLKLIFIDMKKTSFMPSRQRRSISQAELISRISRGYILRKEKEKLEVRKLKSRYSLFYLNL